ncbi:MAG: phosphate signaling complex protein PhoU [Verrucomicrobiaceae bacterium]|nr:phosphate signaling complex protein PhoU [Verrucomicrobiaceae bacterium]
MHDHILSTFDKALRSMREMVLTMISITRKNVDVARRGLLERDTDLCNEAIASDHEVNQLEKDVDQMGMEMLLKFQPAALDLRQIMGTLRVANNMERIADQAAGIAKRARIINQLPEMTELNLIQPLFDLCLTNFEAAVAAFVEGDAEAAVVARAADKSLDAAEREFDQEMLRVMENHSSPLEGYLHLIFVARFLERVGDHAKNICEDTIFIAEAKDVRFLKNKRQATDGAAEG